MLNFQRKKDAIGLLTQVSQKALQRLLLIMRFRLWRESRVNHPMRSSLLREAKVKLLMNIWKHINDLVHCLIYIKSLYFYIIIFYLKRHNKIVSYWYIYICSFIILNTHNSHNILFNFLTQIICFIDCFRCSHIYNLHFFYLRFCTDFEANHIANSIKERLVRI